MKKYLKINNPCSENWDNMKDSKEGKFCEACSKCVIDFTEKTEQEIKDIVNLSTGETICGKISSGAFSKIAASMILITKLTLVQAQINNYDKLSVSQSVQNATKISGRLVYEETQKVIADAEVIFVKKEHLIKTTTNENGYFSIVVPNDQLDDKNLLYFNFEKLNSVIVKKPMSDTGESHRGYENRSVIFSGNKFENERILISGAYTTIGAVVIISDPPPDYYYIDGKNVSKEKFETTRKKHPEYQFFFFEDKEAEVVDNNSFIDSLYLLYSNENNI